jgi:hypothetical protein
MHLGEIGIYRANLEVGILYKVGDIMTWREKFDEGQKTPAVGSDAWFQCIPEGQIEVARKLVEAKVPVCVQAQPGAGNPAFLVLFEDTDFLAGGFDDRSAADGFAGNWNYKLKRELRK